MGPYNHVIIITGGRVYKGSLTPSLVSLKWLSFIELCQILKSVLVLMKQVRNAFPKHACSNGMLKNRLLIMCPIITTESFVIVETDTPDHAIKRTMLIYWQICLFTFTGNIISSQMFD